MLVKPNGKYITQSGEKTIKEIEMATFTLEKTSNNTGMVQIPDPAKSSRAHSGPVARLLARVSKLSDTYAAYEMENGVWRKLAL